MELTINTKEHTQMPPKKTTENTTARRLWPMKRKAPFFVAGIVLFAMVAGCGKDKGNGSGNGSGNGNRIQERPGTPQVIVGNEVDSDGIDAAQWVAGYIIEVAVSDLTAGDMVSLYRGSGDSAVALAEVAPQAMQAVAASKAALRFNVSAYSSELIANTTIFARATRGETTSPDSGSLMLNFSANTQLSLSIVNGSDSDILSDGFLNANENSSGYSIVVAPPSAGMIAMGTLRIVNLQTGMPVVIDEDTVIASTTANTQTIARDDITNALTDDSAYQLVAIVRDSDDAVVGASTERISFRVDTVIPMPRMLEIIEPNIAPVTGVDNPATNNNVINSAEHAAGYRIRVPGDGLVAGYILQLYNNVSPILDNQRVESDETAVDFVIMPNNTIFNNESITYSITVRVRDAAGNEAQSMPLELTLDFTGPTLVEANLMLTCSIDGTKKELLIDYMNANTSAGGETLPLFGCTSFRGTAADLGSGMTHNIPTDYNSLSSFFSLSSDRDTTIDGEITRAEAIVGRTPGSPLTPEQSLTVIFRSEALVFASADTGGNYIVYCAATDSEGNSGPAISGTIDTTSCP